ncbi:HD-GYP domain-containing protein [Herpetosiphon llansteffanensis]|uniref:HD-GYP domain-containing protein n=1 Tax=Herpetosiphon llansteffanensis TaxID=2094568 RepID=UPI0013E05619|nr:HD domain-containing phosphohydrolase [Herpetosiphon llansteffanensis]
MDTAAFPERWHSIPREIAALMPNQPTLPYAAHLILNSIARHSYQLYQHSLRVSHMAWHMSQTLGLPTYEHQQLWLAALLHDCGKTRLPRSVIVRPALGSPHWEVALYHQHVNEGIAILQAYPSLHGLIPLLAEHHERLDGTGFPRGSKYPTRSAQIIALANALDHLRAQPNSLSNNLQGLIDQAIGQDWDSTVAATALSAWRQTNLAEAG